ncbi:MAG: hypothetical protein J5706_09395 [Elusimicrobiales bacterium]|nr:hypothetical protein [Elusimicrobiales bacterium]
MAEYLKAKGIPAEKIEKTSSVSADAKGMFSADPNCASETCDRRADIVISAGE